MFKLLLLIIPFVPFMVFAVYFIYTGFKYTRMISNIFLSLVYNPPAETLISSMGEKMVILDSSDREIEVLVVEKKGSERLVIFCHESGMSKESWEKYAYFIPRLGFNVLSLDFREKSKESEINSLSQWPAREDVERVLKTIHWAKRAFKPDVQIVLFGISNGADIALAASFEEPAVRGIIADGLFSMKEIFRDYIRKWAPILVKPNFFGENYPDWLVNTFTNLSFWYSQKRSRKRFVDVERLLKKRHKPLFMIHGEEDDYVPGTHQRFLEKLMAHKGNFERLIVPKARHNQAVILGKELYERKITEFLGKL